MPRISRKKMEHIDYHMLLFKHVLYGAIISTILAGSVIGFTNIATGVIKISTYHGIAYTLIGAIFGICWNIMTVYRYMA